MRKSLIIFSALLISLCTACGRAEEASTDIPATAVSTVVPTESPSPEPVPREPVTLTVYSQLSGYDGVQQGWFAQVLLEKFNVVLDISVSPDFEEGLEKGFLGDIIVFGGAGAQYQSAVKQGLLADWEEDALLAEHGPYIAEHMKTALEYNRSLTPEAGKIYGFGNSVAAETDSFSELLYSWDIRWDLYQQLGYPEVSDLEDFVALMKDMKELCPTDANGEETYAMAIWPDWDDGVLYGPRYMVGAYYGLDFFHMGFYDVKTGDFQGVLEEDGAYLEMLRFLNTLYREGLLEPASSTRTYEDMLQKLDAGGLFFSPVAFCGSMAYNTAEHIAENKYMASLVPGEAAPAQPGLSVTGGRRNWAIGANSEHKELCMELINWLSTPEGALTMLYGPKGVCWDYDTEGNTYFTELGRACYEDGVTIMPEKYGGSYFRDGCLQINNTTWSYHAANPETNGESYAADTWKSNRLPATCGAEQDWRDFTGTYDAVEYMKQQSCVTIPDIYYEVPEKSESLEKVWEQVNSCIEPMAREAVYAESEAEFDAIVDRMIRSADACGYAQCMEWCERAALQRRMLTEEM